jgi:hypothetical protein
MIKQFAVAAAAAGGLLLASASGAFADSRGYAGENDSPSVVCSINCGNAYVYNPNILGSLLNLLSPPPIMPPPTGGGGGGNN